LAAAAAAPAAATNAANALGVIQHELHLYDRVSCYYCRNMSQQPVSNNDVGRLEIVLDCQYGQQYCCRGLHGHCSASVIIDQLITTVCVAATVRSPSVLKEKSRITLKTYAAVSDKHSDYTQTLQNQIKPYINKSRLHAAVQPPWMKRILPT
jgi:hypothetical protein